MLTLEKRLSLDLKLSTQPIQFVLETLPIEKFIGFAPGSAAMIPTMSNLVYSTVQCWQQELSDKSMSVRNELLAMPEFNVALPFQLPQCIPFTISDPYDAVNNPNPTITMNISSIINSDLTTMLFMVHQSPTGAQSRCNFNQRNNLSPLYGEMLENWTLLLNGQQFFRFNENTYDGVVQALHMDTTAPTIVSFDVTGNTVTRFKSNIYELNFGRLRSIIGEHHLQNTPRFTNQQFQLEFQINRLVNWPASILAGNRTGFILEMVYLYNAVYLVGGDGGTTKLITA
jgi:hypothetical protein